MIYITLSTPTSVKSDKVKKEIEKHLKSGKKTSEILWKLNGVTTESVASKISDDFRKLKNQIALKVRG